MQFIDLKTQYSRIEEKIKHNIDKVLQHGKFIMGPEVFELEEKLANFSGSKYCLSCSSGTDGLLIPLMAKGIGVGDKVLTTPFTYIATAEVINLLGAEPVFIDVDPKTFNINPAHLQSVLDNDNQNIKGIIPVNLFGLCADYDTINKIAKKYNLFVLEDAAQSFGATYKDRRSCSLADVSSTSFFPAKPLGCYGDGGAIFTDDKDLYDVMDSIRIHGKGKDKYDCERIGLNGRLDTIQAAILIAKLELYDEEIDLRQRVANSYSEKLKSYFEVPFVPEDHTSVWAQYSILLEDNSVRERLMNELKEAGVPSMIYYKKPLHLQKTFSDLKYQLGDFPISEDISNRIFSLPMHPYLKESDIEKICKILISNI